MRLNINKNVVLTTLGIIAIAGVTNGGQYYLWEKHNEDVSAEYTQQVEALQMTLDAIGPLVDVYKLLEPGEVGQPITQENLVIGQIPEDMFSDAYILDPSSVVGKFYKVNLSSGSPITTDVVMEEPVKDSNRDIDVVTNVRPSGLKVGDYVDLEIILPNGEKYVVLSKKRIHAITATSAKVIMDSTERHMYQSALVDYFLEMGKGAYIQFVKYVEPGVQRDAQVYYSPSQNVQSVLAIDPNIGETVNRALLTSRRDLIEMAIDRIQGEEMEDRADSIAGGRDEVVAKLNDAYEEYLDALNEATLNGNEEDMYIPVTEPDPNTQPPADPGAESGAVIEREGE